MAVALRAAAPADYQAICDLIQDPDELFLVYPKGTYPFTTEQLERLVERRIEPTVLLRKRSDGKKDELAGFAAFYGHRKRRSIFIGNVIVDRSQRGKGLGREIVSKLIELAFDRYDLPQVRISVYSHNTVALLLYRSLGFVPYAMKEETDWRGERVVLFHLSLAREAYSPTRPVQDSRQSTRRRTPSRRSETVEDNQTSRHMLQILFAGDTAFGGNYQKRLERKGGSNVLKERGYDFGFSHLQPLIDESRFVLANLETTLTTARTSPLKGSKEYIHRDAPTESARALARHGVDAVSLANNHGFDYGDTGLVETREALERRGISMVGAGPDEHVASQWLEREFETGSSRFRLAVVAGKHKWREYKYHYYADEDSAGVNCWTEQTAYEQVRAVRKSDPQAFLVAYPHWGQNYRWRDERQASLAEALIEAGADLVIGHGAHALQEIERIRGRWVVYGLGNFLFNSPGRYGRRKILPFGLAAALRVAETAGQHQLSLRLYPILSDNAVTDYEPRLADEGELQRVHETLVQRQADSTLRDTLTMQRDHIGFCLELPIRDGDGAA